MPGEQRSAETMTNSECSDENGTSSFGGPEEIGYKPRDVEMGSWKGCVLSYAGEVVGQPTLYILREKKEIGYTNPNLHCP